MTAQRDDAVGREAAKAACRQGQELFQLRRREANEQAVALFRRAVESDPTYAPAYVGLATAMCEAMVRYGQPRTLANEALDLALRAVSLGRGNTAAAQEEVEVMLGHRPDDPETLNFAADVALLLGNPEQARTFYERAIDLGSDSRNFYRGRRAKTGLGYLLWVHGEREAALRLLDERREIRMREFAEGLNACGSALRARGDLRRSRTHCPGAQLVAEGRRSRLARTASCGNGCVTGATTRPR